MILALPRQQYIIVAIALAAALSLGTVYCATGSDECIASEQVNGSSTGIAAADPTPSLEQAHQIAMLARQLEDTHQVLQYKQFMGTAAPTTSFRYSTFIYGMLVAWSLVAIAALLGWEYLKHHLQRKQQSAVIGGLKDMDDDTLKKVLGQVSTTCAAQSQSLLLFVFQP